MQPEVVQQHQRSTMSAKLSQSMNLQSVATSMGK